MITQEKMVPKLSKWKYSIVLHKSYFDKGFGITNYFKYLIALFGISSLNVRATLTIAFFYAIFCYVFGWAYFKYGWVLTEREVDNQHNYFVREMRELNEKLK